MPTNMTSLLQQIKETEEHTRIEVSGVPYAMRSGWEMRKNQAIEALPGLMADLRKVTVPQRLVGIIASGDPKVVAEVAEFLASGGGVSVDAAGLYKQIAEKIEPTYSTDRFFRTNQFMGVGIFCQKVSESFGYNGVDLDYLEAFCHTFDDSVAHIRDLIKKSVGDRLLVGYLTAEITKTVAEKSLDAERLPVVVTGSIDSERPGLRSLFARTAEFTFPADFVVTREALLEILKSAK